MNSDSPLTFPCSYPFKVMGHNTPGFTDAVLAVFHRHVEPGALSCESRPSRTGKYLSLTVTFTAESRAQLETLYLELHELDQVLMTL